MDPAGTLGQAFAGYPGHGIISAASADAEAGAVAGNREVVIALIDTGVDISHQELSGSIWINEDEISGNGIEIRHP